MSGNATPRQIVQELLEGVAPQRPLFLPIIFSHGARIESVPLRIFLASPTKISNAARQIRARLRADGITCYFDSFLEAEALGGVLEWDRDGQVASLLWPNDPASLETDALDDPAKRGRIGLAIEVIRRLKSVMREDCLLSAAVAGPFTIASLLAQLDRGRKAHVRDLSVSSLDLATALISPMAKAFVEAGANVLFLHEEILPVLSEEDCADWAARVATAINIVRFYRALPVLLLTDAGSAAANRNVILRQSWDCVVCLPLDGLAPPEKQTVQTWDPARFGIALPPESFQAATWRQTSLTPSFASALRDWRPAVVTTAGDLPSALDIQRLNEVWENLQ